MEELHKDEIGNLFDNFSSLSYQLDIMNIEKKQHETKLPFSIHCSKYRNKDHLQECPLNNVETCAIYECNHGTDQCPLLPKLKCMYHCTNGVTKKHLHMT